VIAIVAYIGALALIGIMDFGDRGYFFTPDAALASDPDTDDEHYSLRDLHLLNRSVGYVRSHYVDPDRVEPQKMLVGALESIQLTIPEVMVIEKDAVEGQMTQATIRVKGQERDFDLTNASDLYQMTWKAKDIMAFLDQHLPESVGRADVEYSAVNGMLQTLDPHSVLLSPETYKEMRVGTSGKFGGLGIVVSSRNGELTVLTVLPDTPAAKAGLENGDKITQIENESTLNMSLDDAVNRLRGEVKTSVTIWILREPWQEPKSFRIQREEIRIQAVQHKDLGRGVGYVRVKSFQQNTLSELKESLDKLEKTGALREGLVLDLRNDPGGLLDQAVAVSDLFLNDGTIVTTVGGSARVREEKKAKRQGTLAEIPMVVLVNRGSASASEIVTGALKNNERALVVGERTFGKGSVQVLYEIEDPRDKTAALKLTIAQYLTPGDKSIQSVGILPDLYMYPVTLSKEHMDLFFSTEDLVGESRLDNHLEANSGEVAGPLKVMRYYEAEEESPEQGAEEEEPEPVNPYGEVEMDYQMLLARDLLVNGAGKTGNQSLLVASEAFLQGEEERQGNIIQERLKELGVDWTPKDGTATPSIKGIEVTIRHGLENGVIQAGEDLNIQATITNNSGADLYQIRGVSESEYSRLDDLEWVFGTVPKGKQRSWTVTVPMPRNAMARATPLELRFFSDQEPLEGLTATSEIRVTPLERPSFAFTYEIRDDRGNGDGLLQAGEDVDLVLSIENVGQGPAFKTRAYVKNLSGEQVFLEKGRGNIESLGVGEQTSLEYAFRVQKGLDVAYVELETEIMDTVLRASLVTPLRIPLHPESKGKFVPGESFWSSGAETRVYTGASDGSPKLTSMKEGAELKGLGSFGSWTKIHLADYGMVGWVSTTELTPLETATNLNDTLPPIEWVGISPAFHFKENWKEWGKVEGDHFVLHGEAIFPKVTGEQIAQVYIFNGERKVFFEETAPEKDSKKATLTFQAKIPLDEGANLIVLYARQDKHIFTRRHLVVHRSSK